MNELSAIGSLRPRTDFRDPHGANTATRRKGTHGERLFGRPKKATLARDYGSFAVVSSYMDKDNVATLEVKAPAGINTKYVIKNTEKLLFPRKVHREIVIA